MHHLLEYQMSLWGMILRMYHRQRLVLRSFLLPLQAAALFSVLVREARDLAVFDGHVLQCDLVLLENLFFVQQRLLHSKDQAETQEVVTPFECQLLRSREF